jgi:hypothetical protein
MTVSRHSSESPPTVIFASYPFLQLTSLSSVTSYSRVEGLFGQQIAFYRAGCNKDQRRVVAMFRLDYLSCFLTVVASILLGRKMWTGLVVSCVNSLVVCVIGLHTSQFGFIPANVFCICINAFNLRAWLKVQTNPSESITDASGELLTGGKRLSTSKEAAPRCSINSFRICRKGRIGHSIPSLAAKGVWPFAPITLRINTKVGIHSCK